MAEAGGGGSTSKHNRNAKRRYKPIWTARSEKRAARFRHSSNVKAGHITVEEYHLNRTGLRGRKRWLIWCALAILLTIALANLSLNIMLIVVFELYPGGLPHMVFQSKDHVMFPKPVNISAAEFANRLSGYYNHSINIQSQVLNLQSGVQRLDQSSNRILDTSEVEMDSSGITIKPYNLLKLDSSSGETVMTLNKTTAWIAPPLHTKSINTSTIITDSVCVQDIQATKSTIAISEGIELHSSNDVAIATQSGDIRTVMNGHFVIKQGLFLPNLLEHQLGELQAGNRLCMCSNGRVFRTQGNTCLIDTSIYNPCRNT